jgi:hypothetical protein
MPPDDMRRAVECHRPLISPVVDGVDMPLFSSVGYIRWPIQFQCV